MLSWCPNNCKSAIKKPFCGKSPFVKNVRNEVNKFSSFIVFWCFIYASFHTNIFFGFIWCGTNNWEIEFCIYVWLCCFKGALLLHIRKGKGFCFIYFILSDKRGKSRCIDLVSDWNAPVSAFKLQTVYILGDIQKLSNVVGEEFDFVTENS